MSRVLVVYSTRAYQVALGLRLYDIYRPCLVRAFDVQSTAVLYHRYVLIVSCTAKCTLSLYYQGRSDRPRQTLTSASQRAPCTRASPRPRHDRIRTTPTIRLYLENDGGRENL